MCSRSPSMILVEYEVAMIPYSYNMVDMGGIDLAEANGTVVPGVYEKIVEAMNLCGDLILYNWKFAEISIAPSACTILQQADSILINRLIQVTELDEITVLGIEPPPPPIVPVSPLDVIANGTYEAEPPASGFNPVRVAVPERIPVVEPLQVAQNGIYMPPVGVDGFSPVTVSVESGGLSNFPISYQVGDFTTGWYQSRKITRVLQEGNLIMARYRIYNGWYTAGAYYSLRDYPLNDVVTGDYAKKTAIDISSVGLGYDTLYAYGGQGGSGRSGAVYFSIGGSLTYLTVFNEVNANVPTGPTDEADFGYAFDHMSDTLKQEFWSAILQTI